MHWHLSYGPRHLNIFNLCCNSNKSNKSHSNSNKSSNNIHKSNSWLLSTSDMERVSFKGRHRCRVRGQVPTLRYGQSPLFRLQSFASTPQQFCDNLWQPVCAGNIWSSACMFRNVCVLVCVCVCVCLWGVASLGHFPKLVEPESHRVHPCYGVL